MGFTAVASLTQNILTQGLCFVRQSFRMSSGTLFKGMLMCYPLWQSQTGSGLAHMMDRDSLAKVVMTDDRTWLI